MKVVNYLCPHGLNPGPYKDWTPEHLAEHQWLLGVCKNVFQATHINLPTEAFSHFRNDFTFEKLKWFCQEVTNLHMIPVVWIDKWFWAQISLSDFALGLVRATEGFDVVWNLGQEVDYLWLLHDQSKVEILQRLNATLRYLLSRNVPRRRIWLGGATVEGTKQLYDEIGPGVATWTAWEALQRRGDVNVNVESDLLELRNYIPTNLCAIEVGWSSKLVHRSGRSQALVLESALIGVRGSGCTDVGLWLPIDCPHEQIDKTLRGYGLIGADTQSNTWVKPSLEVWRELS